MYDLTRIFYPFIFQAGDISVFEVNIRFVGGLLSLYALTGDKVSHILVLSTLNLPFSCDAVFSTRNYARHLFQCPIGCLSEDPRSTETVALSILPI